jgi:hypothetical protein
MAENPFSMAVRHAGSQVGWFSDLMGTVVSWQMRLARNSALDQALKSTGMSIAIGILSGFLLAAGGDDGSCRGRSRQTAASGQL